MRFERTAAGAAAVLLLVLLAGAAAPGSLPVAAPTPAVPSPTAAVPPTGVVKYYIVGPSIDGRPEYLFDIAVRTLGTGRRYLEIVSLNQGRIQPDGARLEDPAVLHPGWILILPPDADGAAVHTGPLPTLAPVPPTAAPAARPAAAGSSNRVSRLPVFVVVVVVIGAALWVLGRGRRLIRSGNRRRVEREVSTVVGQPDPPAAPAPVFRSSSPVLEVTDPHGSVLEAEVTLASGTDTAAVRLAGIRLRQTQPGWMWLDPDAARPLSPTLVALGSTGGAALCVDVAQAPDVITVVGHLPGSRRLAASLVNQLSDAGVAVTVVGTAVGATVTGAYTVPTLAEAARIRPVTEPHVIVCGPGGESDTVALRQLTVRSKPRTVVVLVGPERRSRWSIQVQPPRVDQPSQREIRQHVTAS
jgi:hypothetical protein